MKPLFSFGTLMDDDVLEAVSGQSRSSLRCEAGQLEGYAQREVVGQDFPVLVADPNAVTHGVIISGLSANALDRILFFEGDEYRLRDVEVKAADGHPVSCQFFTDTAVYDIRETAWDFVAWTTREKSDFLVRASDYMKLFGTMSGTEADAFW